MLAVITDGPIKINNNKFTSPSTTKYEISYGKFNSIILNYYTEGYTIPANLALCCLQNVQKRETGVFVIN